MRASLFGLVALRIFCLLLLVCSCGRKNNESFEREMVAGQGAYEKGDATNAITAYSKAVTLAPESIDAHLNLANAYLLANNPPAAIEECKQVLNLDHNQAAAYYMMGCAYQRL